MPFPFQLLCMAVTVSTCALLFLLVSTAFHCRGELHIQEPPSPLELPLPSGLSLHGHSFLEAAFLKPQEHL